MKEKLPVTPMMQQYLKIKEEYADCILFFRLGDFYEMFFDDAITASEVLEITLTGKDCGMEERAPMCGVPYHSVQGYIAKLIKSGYKVANTAIIEDNGLNYVIRTKAGYLERVLVKVKKRGEDYSIVKNYSTSEIKELENVNKNIKIYYILQGRSHK